MTLIFSNSFGIQASSDEGGGGGTTPPVFNGTYVTSDYFNLFKNTSFSVGGSGLTGGIELDLSSVILPETITSAAIIMKIRPINQAGGANSIFFSYDPTTSNSQNKIQLNGPNPQFAYYDRLTGSNNKTTDVYAVTYDSIGKKAYYAAIVFENGKNYGYIVEAPSGNTPITSDNFCDIPLTDNSWHKTVGLVGSGVSGSFLKSNYRYLLATGGLLNETTSQMFSGIIHLDSVELRINGDRVWTLIS